MMFGVRTFTRGINGTSANTGKDAVSHGALFDSETGLLKIVKTYEWDDEIDPSKPTMYIGDFDPRGIAQLDYKFSIDDMPKAIEVYMELVATGRFEISEEIPNASDLDPRDVIFVQGFKTSGKGADILITEMVTQSHISILALCLFSKSIQDSADFVECLGDYGDDDEDEPDLCSGLQVQSLSFGFGGLMK